ncbi:NPC intracellular cholesterol transporter 1 [Hydra vulgaris]|uniref:NPC intracellular cholesterol transporter 1 n=1 Tax=Hydra vulgaris TaxID=6087 RepID=UPI000640F135|nr:NPC intracellular cholesterol transporter 1 [Hydra vulgaris]
MCTIWFQFCYKLHNNIGNAFKRWGLFVWDHPTTVIICSLFMSFAFCFGFLRFDIYGQSERIHYPQNSRIFKDLAKVEDTFNYFIQTEEFVIFSTNKEQSVLTAEVFKVMQTLHNTILEIPGINEFCVQINKLCLTNNVLDNFYYLNDTTNQINDRLLTAYFNESYLMSNGAPAKYNFPLLLGNMKINNTNVFAKALRVQYYIRFPKTRKNYEKNKLWETKMMDYLKSNELTIKSYGYNILYNTVRSLDDAVAENTVENLPLVSISIGLMVLFCSVSVTRIGSLVMGHFVLSLFGILCITLGIGAGFGFTFLIGQPFASFVGVLPFLVIGIGIDDMFIILNKVDCLHSVPASSDKLGKVMQDVGFTITMTTITDLVAFIIGCTSSFPSVRIFCIFAIFSIFFVFLMLNSLFLALLVYDMKRIDNSRIDCVPWMRRVKDVGNESSSSYFTKVMECYGSYLMKTSSKIIVTFLSIVMVVLGVYGCYQTDLNFDFKIIGPDHSKFVKWINTIEKYFPAEDYFPIDLVLKDPNIDYSSSEIQNQFFALDQIAKEKYFNSSYNWLTSYVRWSNKSNFSNFTFSTKLNEFLSLHPMYKRDILFDRNKNILASRVHFFTKPVHSWIFRRDAMLSLRKSLEKLKIEFIPVSFPFIYASQLVVIVQETLVNLIICCLVILFVTLPYLIHFKVTFLLFVSFVFFTLELFAVMYIWGLSLNSITMIVLVMAIGFSVDYSCHITHGYLISQKLTPEDRIIDSLVSLGGSVLKGGGSTLIGVLVLACSSSKLFVLFFKMMFTIITLGLLHGLVALPVFLTIFCRFSKNIDEDPNNEKKGLAEDEKLSNINL